MTRYYAPLPKPREQIRSEGLGWKGDAYPRMSARTSTVMVDGTAYFISMPFRAGEVVTNIVVSISGAGTGTSLSKAGIGTISNLSWTRTALTADQGTAWNSTGTYQIALISPYTIPTEGVYYICVVAKTATTMPSMYSGVAATVTQLSTNPLEFACLGGQTDVPSSGTVTGTNSIPFWVAWS